MVNNILYLPDRLYWCPGSGFHALGVALLHLLDASAAWVKQKPAFIDPYGREFHLFFSTSQNTVCYAGTYKALDLRHLGTEGYADMPNELVVCNQSCVPLLPGSVIGWQEMGEVVEASIRPAKGKNVSNKTKHSVIRLYQSQLLKGELLGLQCTGFDTAAYNTLKAKCIRAVEMNEVYYPTAAQSASGPSKKRRREE